MKNKKELIDRIETEVREVFKDRIDFIAKELEINPDDMCKVDDRKFVYNFIKNTKLPLKNIRELFTEVIGSKIKEAEEYLKVKQSAQGVHIYAEKLKEKYRKSIDSVMERGSKLGLKPDDIYYKYFMSRYKVLVNIVFTGDIDDEEKFNILCKSFEEGLKEAEEELKNYSDKIIVNTGLC